MNLPPRQLTLLFADVLGSVRLYERLTDDEAARTVERCMKRISRCCESARGRIVKIVGDELLAVFDSVEDACLAAIDMQARLADLPPVSGIKPGIRVGLHEGKLAESAETLADEEFTTAARITGWGSADQIVFSQDVLAVLPASLAAMARALPDLGRVTLGEVHFSLYELCWQKPVEDRPVASLSPPRLHLEHSGKPLILVATSPALSIGRDQASKVLVEDHKASRKHATIEHRTEGFFYIDNSTNGSFITFDGQQEILLRHDAILLHGKGRICFGNSGNDPKSERIAFELR